MLVPPARYIGFRVLHGYTSAKQSTTFRGSTNLLCGLYSVCLSCVQAQPLKLSMLAFLLLLKPLLLGIGILVATLFTSLPANRHKLIGTVL